MGTANETDESIPLGGIGAGAVELGPDGCFRNISINNNRTDASRIPVAQNSFIAIRTAYNDQISCRILQREDATDSTTSDQRPAGYPAKQFSFRGKYPAAHYSITDPDAGVEIVWSTYAPIIPFDHEASTLPVFFSAIRVKNKHQVPIRVSLLFNWENICGQTGEKHSKTTAPITPLDLRKETPNTFTPEKKETETDDDELELERPRFHALQFGTLENIQSNADGQYCFATRPHQKANISVLAWDPLNQKDSDSFWTTFRKHGHLQYALPRSGYKRAGAICLSFLLKPNENYRTDFVLSWYCPRFIVQDRDIGNGYAQTYKNALDIAYDTLQRMDYFATSIEQFQQHLSAGDLPKWMKLAFLSSLKLFSTQTVFTKEKRLAFMQEHNSEAIAPLPYRFNASFALSLLFPRFEDTELHAQPWQGEDKMERIHFVLSACRNYFLMGNLAYLQFSLPKMNRIMHNFYEECSESSLRQADNVFIATLASALRAYIALLTHTRQKSAVLRPFGTLYENTLKALQYIENNAPEKACSATHKAALISGQWAADLFDWGDLLGKNRLSELLHEGKNLAPTEHLVPLEYACLLMRHQQPSLGLQWAQEYTHTYMRSPHLQQAPAFLGIWHFLYAYEGFFYNAPAHTLRIAPCFSPGEHNACWPLFTPLCLGQIQFEESCTPSYRQNLEIHFDSPLKLRKILLRVPQCDTIDFTAQCYMHTDRLPCVVTRHTSANIDRLHITLKTPLEACQHLAIQIDSRKRAI